MIIFLIFQLLANASGSFESFCREKRISVCDRKAASTNIVYVLSANDGFLEEVKNSLCFYNESGTVK